MTKNEKIEKEVKNVKAKVAEVKEKDALDLTVDAVELEKKVEKKAKAAKARVAEVKDKDALDLAVDTMELEKKVEKKAKAAKAKVAKKTIVFIQSPMGGEITPEEILVKVGNVDKVYVRLDQNKLHWVKGDETGSVDIW